MRSRDVMSLVQGSHQYMPIMHGMGLDHRSMQNMYNSAPQPIPGHMNSHSRSYPPDLGMSHHNMSGQVDPHSLLSAPVVATVLCSAISLCCMVLRPESEVVSSCGRQPTSCAGVSFVMENWIVSQPYKGLCFFPYFAVNYERVCNLLMLQVHVC